MSLFNNSSSRILVNYNGYSLESQFILDTIHDNIREHTIKRNREEDTIHDKVLQHGTITGSNYTNESLTHCSKQKVIVILGIHDHIIIMWMFTACNHCRGRVWFPESFDRESVQYGIQPSHYTLIINLRQLVQQQLLYTILQYLHFLITFIK